jgi:hypothetical protein
LDLIEPDATRYTDPSDWRPAVHAPPPRVSISKTPGSADASAQAKAADALPPNPVPEPSAVILGSLALLYFLVFGRRRRIA